MGQFDEFNARVERAKEAVDRKIDTGRESRGGRSMISDFLTEFLGEILLRVWWGILLVGGGVGVVAFSLGISFSAALTLTLAVGVGFVIVAAMMAGG